MLGEHGVHAQRALALGDDVDRLAGLWRAAATPGPRSGRPAAAAAGCWPWRRTGADGPPGPVPGRRTLHQRVRHGPGQRLAVPAAIGPEPGRPPAPGDAATIAAARGRWPPAATAVLRPTAAGAVRLGGPAEAWTAGTPTRKTSRIARITTAITATAASGTGGIRLQAGRQAVRRGRRCGRGRPRRSARTRRGRSPGRPARRPGPRPAGGSWPVTAAAADRTREVGQQPPGRRRRGQRPPPGARPSRRG